MTSKPLVSRTLATLRSAEFGFFGSCVDARANAALLRRLLQRRHLLARLLYKRGLAISWLIVGMSAFTLSSCENPDRLRKFIRDSPVPSGRNARIELAQSEIAPTAHC